MARRLPSQPPILPGFSHVHVLGSGGFADVFLFEQNMPRRQVAVKVMLAEVVNDQVRQMFQAEANLMAQLSAHPSILTVYQAGVSSDGRPYLVMELCSSSLSQRYRSERLPVADVLRIGVKIGSAIETAHRAGVLHRDIKPSNILVTAYGHPVLSDFGIAATLAESGEREAVGMSIPWSAPEVLMDETAGTIASEVWAFAATVYSLLAGRSPFEVPGQSNKSADLISRINRAKVLPIGRPDVPPSLERALARAMSRRPESRQASVMELVRELQSVESEMGVAQTPIEIAVDDWASSTVADLEDRTVIKGGNPTPSSVAQRRRRRRGGDTEFSSVGTIIKEDPVAAPSGNSLRPVAGRGLTALAWALVGVAALVVGLGVFATVILVQSAGTGTLAVSDIEARVEGDTVEFSWSDPGIGSADTFQVSADSAPPVQQRTSTFVVAAEPGDRVCITVAVNSAGRVGPPSAQKCADVPE
ncbi:serine/threonine protein kinase [Antiquaquibacter oligotrophicus]|uniref:serine/threonine-protein kinase n=1 Tax=Antiquaquibacter oligotrophicus TaxID=2880260 RepID=UPI002AC9D01C|nr:serine/threonine-protein kinase [Antiquaquibacter oligotrophicus]UDF13696.1 serine/threonine protein kinase [Antiquaquibacter oligotrophicus]